MEKRLGNIFMLIVNLANIDVCILAKMDY